MNPNHIGTSFDDFLKEEGIIMNDRFKFRSWHEPTKTMEYNGLWTGRDWDKKLCDCNFKLMQCTGLKDKNGKLIYDLDHIEYKKEIYKLSIDKFLGITLTNILNGDIIIMDDLILFNCEVISNEFECNTKI